MSRLLLAVSFVLTVAACPPPEPIREPSTQPLGRDVEELDFITPSGSVTSPVTFLLDAPEEVAWVRLTEMQAGITLGDSSDATAGFELTASFPLPGLRRVEAIGYDADDQTVARGEQSFEVVSAPGGRHGLWLHDLAATGLNANELAQRVADLGVGRLFVRVADGPLDCVAVPGGCDAKLTAALRDAGVTPWAVVETHPDDPGAQADALFDLLPLHFEGVVLRAGDRFVGRDDDLTALVEAFVIVRGQCVGSGLHTGELPLLADLPGGTLEPVADLIDGWSPRATDADSMAERWCAIEAASDRPIWPILDAAAPSLDAWIGQAGADASVHRIPDAADADAGWARLEAIDWTRTEFETPTCQ